MNPVVAANFLLICAWFLSRQLLQGHLKHLVKASIASIVILVGFLKLLDYLLDLPFNVDTLIFQEELNAHTLHNGIAPTSALLFLLLGTLMLSSYSRNRVIKIVNDVLLLVVFLIAYIGIIGYVYSIEPFYRIGPFVPMALNTALCFFALIIAVFLSFPHGNLAKIYSSRFIGGKLVRNAIPLILLIPPAFGYVRLLLLRMQFYNVEYGIALETAFIMLVVLVLVFYYANEVSKNDRGRIKAEKVMMQNEETYRSLVYTLKEGVVYFDMDMKILFYNPSFSEMTGYGADELIGKSITDTLIPEENKAITDRRIAARLQGLREDYESYILHKNGTRIMVNIIVRPILKDGIPVSFLCTMIDITERKKREEDLEAFSASAAHDLSAPLVRIHMLANYILDMSRDHLTADDVEYLKIILKTTVDMRALLKDLLLFAKIGAEKINKEAIDMKGMVKKIIKNLQPTTAILEVADLPEAYGEATAIRQVWTNLIHNAIKYSSKKEQSAIEIGHNIQGDKIIYYVRDNGAGFSMNDAHKLFVPFKRLHSDFEGNGMGLPIVKRIIEKHNGNIWAESERGKGATFYFSL